MFSTSTACERPVYGSPTILPGHAAPLYSKRCRFVQLAEVRCCHRLIRQTRRPCSPTLSMDVAQIAWWNRCCLVLPGSIAPTLSSVLSGEGTTMERARRMEKLNINPDPRLEPAPERTGFDYGVSVAKAGTIVFPFLGAGVTLFDLITTPLRTKRLSDWLEQLRLRINELSQKVATLTPVRLAED